MFRGIAAAKEYSAQPPLIKDPSVEQTKSEFFEAFWRENGYSRYASIVPSSMTVMKNKQSKMTETSALVTVSKELEQIKKLRKITRKQIPLSNDVFMIFAMNKKFCQEFLRVILQDKKFVVIKNNIQKIYRMYLASQKYKTTSEIEDLIYGEGETKMSSEIKKWINDIRKDAKKEGKEEGKREGKIEFALNMFKKKLIELKDAAKLLGMSEENFSKLVNA